MKKIILFMPFLLIASEIKSIEFEGLVHISPLTAKSLIEIRENQQLNLEKIDKSIKKLFSTGYFDYIEAIKKENKIIFKCKEKPIIAKIEFKNLSEDLKKLLEDEKLIPKKGEMFSKKKIEKLKQFIKNYYLAKSYFNTIVYVKKEEKNNKIYLTIEISKGQKIIITKVNFQGNRQIPDSLLLDEITNKERNCFSWIPFFNSGELNLFSLMQDRANLQKFYLNQGFIDAKVHTPLATTDFSSYSAKIDFNIKEGKRYIVKKIEIVVPSNIKVKLPPLNLKENKYFNVTALQKDLEDIKHAFENEGYAYAKVYPTIEKKGKFASVKYNVLPGEIVYINNVIIKGNTKTLDRVIRRNIFLAPGDKFSYQNLIDSKNALQRTGYLEQVKIIKKRVSPNKIDLIVNVKEGLSGSLRAGISYGSYTKLGFTLDLTERNVFGSGQALSIKANISSVSKTYSINLTNPRVFDSLYSLNFSIFKSNFEGISYTEKKSGFKIGVGKQLSKFISTNISYGYTNTKLEDYNTTEYIKPKSTKSYISSSITYNSTDNFFFPTKGVLSELSIEAAGIGGDEKFIKTDAIFKYFYPLTNKTYQTNFVLKYKIAFGVIYKLGYLPINEKYYLGGMRTIRGFDYYSIAPKDSEGTLIGGKYQFITGPEISTPISRKNRLWASLFVDYGAVGENSLNIQRSSYGVAINWITPMGPLSFIWAFPIQYKKEDNLQRFEFNIGTSF